jgi:hypothetical protein
MGQNYFSYLLCQTFIGALNGGSTTWSRSQHDELEKSLDNDSFQNFYIIASAGGMNNEMYFAEKIADDIYERNQQVSFPLIFHLFCRICPTIYDQLANSKSESNDPTAIIGAFKKKERSDFKRGTISTAGIVSLFLSATTYSIFTQEPLTLYGFRLPDVFPYITTKGMSYKVVSGYEINKDLKLIFGFEKVFGTEPATEFNLGINRTVKLPIPMQYKGIVTFGRGLDFEATCTVPVSPRFSVGLGCEIYACESLQGQRHASKMLSKSGSELSDGYSGDVFAFVSYRY